MNHLMLKRRLLAQSRKKYEIGYIHTGKGYNNMGYIPHLPHLNQMIEAKRAAKPSESDLKIWYAQSGATNGTMQPTYWSLTDMWKRSKASPRGASWIAWQKLVDDGKVQGVKESQMETTVNFKSLDDCIRSIINEGISER